MFEVVHFRHKWLGNSQIESELTHNGEKIATTVVHVDTQTIEVLAGGFDCIAENPALLKSMKTTHLEFWLDSVKKHATNWATRNRQ